MSEPKSRPPKRPAPTEAPFPLWIVGLFVAGLVVAMVWVTDHFIEYDKLQRCVTAGHRDCGPPVLAPK